MPPPVWASDCRQSKQKPPLCDIPSMAAYRKGQIMKPEEIMLIVTGVCLYIGIPAGMIYWAVSHQLKKRRKRRICQKAYQQARQALEARLSSLLQRGMALDASVWIMDDNEGVADIFFDLLFRTARRNRPIILPACAVEAFSNSWNVSPAVARMQKFRQAGLLVIPKEGLALNPENFPVIVRVATDSGDLFGLKIDYHVLTEEIAAAYRKCLLA